MINNNEAINWTLLLFHLYTFNTVDHSAGTSSIDTTCTIWGLETGQVLGRVNLVSGHVKTQLIAHDKEVSVCLRCKPKPCVLVYTS